MKKLVFAFVLTLAIVGFSSSSFCEEVISRLHNKNVKVESSDCCGEHHSSKGKCIHIDKHIPWNLCDKCGLHKVYW